MSLLSADDDVLFCYTRTEAIEDGVLIDVSESATEIGFLLPVAITQALWEDINNIPEESGQDVQGRLWDILWMGLAHVRRGTQEGILFYRLILPLGSLTKKGQNPKALYQVKLVISFEEGKRVITLMKPNED